MRALIEDLSEAVKENATRDNVADWIANRLINLDARSAYDSNTLVVDGIDVTVAGGRSDKGKYTGDYVLFYVMVGGKVVYEKELRSDRMHNPDPV